MNKPTILVTGAGGFLGCRLVECLLAQGKYEVRAMAHRPAGAVRLVRLPVNPVWCDITKLKDIEACMKGVDIVVHCAYGTAPVAADARAATIVGTRNLANAAAKCGVKRFIHISTIAVHSYAPAPGVTEDSPFGPASDSYCKEKIAAELAIRACVSQHGLPVTVLRMGNIHGPFSGPWTMRPLAHIKSGFETLVDDGGSASNMVYVDNAVEAILRAMIQDKAVGETFFVVDDTISWREHYEQYASWLGGVALRSVPLSKVNELLHVSALRKVCSWVGDVRDSFVVPTLRDAAYHAAESQSLGKLAGAIWRPVPMNIRERFLGKAAAAPSYVVDMPTATDVSMPQTPLGLLQVYAGKAPVSNEKAKRVLGFGPAVSFDEAMRCTRQWAEWARLIPSV